MDHHSSAYLRVDPGVVLLEALGLVVDDVDVEAVAVGVDALEELAAEELDAHDGEDEPEDEAHQQHVEDRRDRVHQSVHHDLGKGGMQIHANIQLRYSTRKMRLQLCLGASIKYVRAEGGGGYAQKWT